MADDGNGDDEYMYDDDAISGLYSACAVLIFLMVTGNFLFPVNNILPIDRRTVAILGATLVFVTHTFLFPGVDYKVINGVDFEVLILLAGIMCINFLIVKEPSTIVVVKKIQTMIKEEPRKGFWAVGMAAFILSPFLTNDGVCLLFVAPVMAAFVDMPTMSTSGIAPEDTTLQNIVPMQSDALYFGLNVACGANIGSVLTYIGNPQNLIVAQDAISVMPPYMFLGYQLVPSLISFVVTTLYLEYCWLASHKSAVETKVVEKTIDVDSSLHKRVAVGDEEAGNGADVLTAQSEQELLNPMSPTKRQRKAPKAPFGRDPFSKEYLAVHASDSAMSASAPSGGDEEKVQEGQEGGETHYSEYWLQGPFPYSMVCLTLVMVLCIFAEVMTIAGIIASFAIIMTISVVLSNYWKGTQVLVDTHDGPQLVPLTQEQKVENVNFFFEELFASIDMNILLIFVGLFIVVDNLDSTGIPKAMWTAIVGNKPFRSVSSVVGISCFVLIMSQFVGNVPVIQLAKPNCEDLDDAAKRYAWAVLAFVSTVGGNLTLTGSAANVIVAEQMMRIPNAPPLDFWKHLACCFGITLFSIAVGTGIITLVVGVDAGLSGYE